MFWLSLFAGSPGSGTELQCSRIVEKYPGTVHIPLRAKVRRTVVCVYACVCVCVCVKGGTRIMEKYSGRCTSPPEPRYGERLCVGECMCMCVCGGGGGLQGRGTRIMEKYPGTVHIPLRAKVRRMVARADLRGENLQQSVLLISKGLWCIQTAWHRDRWRDRWKWIVLNCV